MESDALVSTSISDGLEIDIAEETKMEKAPSKKPNQNKRFLRLPLARVKKMMKQDKDCGMVSQDAVFLVAKATEMFIEYMGRKATDQVSNTKRKTVFKRDIDTVIASVPHLCFLDGALE